MVSYRSFLELLAQVLLLLTSISAQSTSNGAGCTMCFDGSPPNGTIVGTDCAVLQEDIKGAPFESDACRKIQVDGFRFCQCPSYPSAYFCPLCAHSFYDIPDIARMIPLLNITCEDVLFGDSTKDGECTSYARADGYCGCPNVSATGCKLCDLSATSVTAGYLNRSVPPEFKYTCQDYVDAADSKLIDDCSTAATVLGAGIPLDLLAYCGCTGHDAPTAPTCVLCPDPEHPLITNDTTAVLGGQKCSGVALAASYITDVSFCNSTITPLRQKCCFGMQPVQTNLATTSGSYNRRSTSWSTFVFTVILAAVWIAK